MLRSRIGFDHPGHIERAVLFDDELAVRLNDPEVSDFKPVGFELQRQLIGLDGLPAYQSFFPAGFGDAQVVDLEAALVGRLRSGSLDPVAQASFGRKRARLEVDGRRRVDVGLEGGQLEIRHLDLGFHRRPGRLDLACGIDLAALTDLQARLKGHGRRAVDVVQDHGDLFEIHDRAVGPHGKIGDSGLKPDNRDGLG